MNVTLHGGFFDGKTIPDQPSARFVLPVVESCGCHFSSWEYDRDGEFVVCSTWVGDIVDPERFPQW